MSVNYTAPAPYFTPSAASLSQLPLSFYNSSGLVTNPDVAAAATAAPGDLVFPFHSSPSYYVVAGSCGSDSAPNGYATDGVAVPTSGSLTPGGTASATIMLTPVTVVVANTGGQLSGSDRDRKRIVAKRGSGLELSFVGFCHARTGVRNDLGRYSTFPELDHYYDDLQLRPERIGVCDLHRYRGPCGAGHGNPDWDGYFYGWRYRFGTTDSFRRSGHLFSDRPHSRHRSRQRGLLG